jgi:hypothetical protein
MKPGGGYVCSPSHDYLLPETPVENVIAMFETVREFGGYAWATGAQGRYRRAAFHSRQSQTSESVL